VSNPRSRPSGSVEHERCSTKPSTRLSAVYAAPVIVSEFAKKGGFLKGDKYGLSIVLTGGTEDQLVEELRQAKEALLDWFRDRGKSGDFVMFAVMSSAMHQAADATLRDIVAQERDLSAPLQQRTVMISLAGLGGKTVSEATWSDGRWT
jgi:hypothetical protein